jgi:hypothetical protein
MAWMRSALHVLDPTIWNAPLTAAMIGNIAALLNAGNTQILWRA